MPYVAVGVVLDEVNLIVEVFFDDGLQLCVKFLNLCGIGLCHFSVDSHNPALVWFRALLVKRRQLVHRRTASYSPVRHIVAVTRDGRVLVFGEEGEYLAH